MAYMRGEYYLWVGEEDLLHIWVKDGYDGWDACYEEEDGSRISGYENASGVNLPLKVMDEFVMMRLARLILDGKVEETIDRAIDPNGRGGNFGGTALQHNAEKLKAALRQIQLDQPPPIR